MREVGDYRDPIKVYFNDLTERIKSLENTLLLVGGDFNVHAHQDAYSQLLLGTKVREVNQLNNMQHIPTYQRIPHQLDKILISEELLGSSRKFHIAPFDLFFLSDHSALVLDLNFRGVVIPPRPKPRILTSSNANNEKNFLKLVIEKLEKVSLLQQLDLLEEKEVFTEEDTKLLCALENQFTWILKTCEKKLSRRQYLSYDFTPLLQILRKKRRYFRKLIAHRKLPFKMKYLSNLWDGHEVSHLKYDVNQLRVVISEVQEKIKKHQMECSREHFWSYMDLLHPLESRKLVEKFRNVRQKSDPFKH